MSLWAGVLVLAVSVQEEVPQETATVAPLESSLRLQLEVRREKEGRALEDGAQLWNGEVVLVDILLEGEPGFLDQQVVAQWRMPLDLQMGLSSPFLEPREDVAWAFHGEKAPGDTSLVVDRDKGAMLRLPDTAEGWRRYRWRRAVIVSGSDFQLPSARLHVVWATRFEQDLVRGDVPLNRQEDSLVSAAWDFPVAQIPEEDVPDSFLGAVGAFRLEPVWGERDGQVGSAEAGSPPDRRRLTLRFTGSGVLTAAHLPDLSRLEGVHVFGQRMETSEDGLRLFLELQVDPSIEILPRFLWAFFDPRPPAHFEVLEIPALDLGRGVSPEASETDSPTPTPSSEEHRSEGTFSNATLALAIAGAALLCVALLWRGRPLPPTADPGPGRPAIRRTVVSVPPAQAPKDLIDHLSLFLQCPREQVYAGQLIHRLTQAGLADDFATDLADAVERVLQARFAESGNLPSASTLAALVHRLTEATSRLQPPAGPR
ncbi:MAG: hypothetical protein ACYTEP_02325 [Planctomycetota bacterium]